MMEAGIKAWRTAERARLLEARRCLTSAERERATAALVANLDRILNGLACSVLGIYWPINAEFDIRGWASTAGTARGFELALPVVVRKQQALEYWSWHPGAPMVRGFWGIMVPERRVTVRPDVVIAPLVGFAGLYRLGYGGGYFDRTLAAAKPRPHAIGVGLESTRVSGFVPEPHDIAMDVIVTEKAIHPA